MIGAFYYDLQELIERWCSNYESNTICKFKRKKYFIFSDCLNTTFYWNIKDDIRV